MRIFPAILFATAMSLTPERIVRAGEPKQSTAEKATVTKDVTPDEAALAMKGKALVIDVRTPDEFAEGHIHGARNVDFLGDDFEKQLAALPTDRPLIVHCAAGNRSSKAVATLVATGRFAQIFHLKSGFNGWKAAGKPIETKPAAK